MLQSRVTRGRFSLIVLFFPFNANVQTLCCLRKQLNGSGENKGPPDKGSHILQTELVINKEFQLLRDGSSERRFDQAHNFAS